MYFSALGVGALVLVLQLVLAHRCRSSPHRILRTAAASIAVLISVLLLESGHQAQRLRPPKHESFEARSLRDRPGATTPAAGTALRWRLITAANVHAPDGRR
ncbi:hypothetical protein [Actinoplanes sp. NBRC 101535]|uniref:hypothetical protein n=1 Tax=Actinoplanes sp. NBRC 101535 TaxID=3032196 RepID=UPI00249FDFF6|nr:hypothetical protein [Actinoplanes sp. NBRC 101535]GLY08463.1 hypothetical protein Acsp01_88420 [Actinoplanes sp. NBRC 101535]